MNRNGILELAKKSLPIQTYFNTNIILFYGHLYDFTSCKSLLNVNLTGFKSIDSIQFIHSLWFVPNSNPNSSSIHSIVHSAYYLLTHKHYITLRYRSILLLANTNPNEYIWITPVYWIGILTILLLGLRQLDLNYVYSSVSIRDCSCHSGLWFICN